MTPQLLTVVEQFWHRMPGGTATATEMTLAALADLGGYQLAGIAARHAPPNLSEQEGWRRLPAGSTLNYHSLPRPLLYESWLRIGLPTVDRYLTGPGLVWASSMIAPPTSAPMVVTVHDLDFLHHPEFSTRRGRRFFPLAWERAKERADLLVCPSELVADDCVMAGASAERLMVVPWGVAPPRCGPERAAAIRDDLNLPERFVLWVGPLDPRKNPIAAARAMGRVDCDLVLVGAGGARPQAEHAFASLGTRVHRLGRVDDETLSALYQLSSALLYPSIAEGFGLPVLEAMAHGTPVVTSIGTATEEVAGGAALTVDPGDVDGMADAIQAAVFDRRIAERLSLDGLVRAGQLTWSATAKGYAEAFRAVL